MKNINTNSKDYANDTNRLFGISRGKGKMWECFWCCTPKTPPPIHPTPEIPKEPKNIKNHLNMVFERKSYLNYKPLYHGCQYIICIQIKYQFYGLISL